MKWALVNAAGAVLNTGYAPDSTTLESFTGVPGTAILNVPEDVETHTHYYDHATHAFVPLPACPSDEHYFDHVNKVWVQEVPRVEARVRAQRGRLLAQSDWTQISDAPVADRHAWVVYRQALRDLPAQPGFPTSVTWPTPPG